MAIKNKTKDERPRIKLSLTTADKIIEAMAVMTLLGFWLYTFIQYKALPQVIPTHFNADGQADGYGLKWTILTLPLIGLVFYIGLTLLGRYPHKFNYPGTITNANAEAQYQIGAQMMRVMKLMLIIVFFVMTYQTVQTAMGGNGIINRGGLFLDFGLLFAPIFYFLIKMSKNA